MELVDITSLLQIPAFVVLIWQLKNVNDQLKNADERYERLVTRFIEALDAVEKTAAA